jgi:glucose-6-phosphate isomerase
MVSCRINRRSRTRRKKLHHIRIDYTNTAAALEQALWTQSRQRARTALQTLINRNGPGSDFLGWRDLPLQPHEDVSRILERAERIRADSDAVIVVGIGGSYLGARAVIDALRPGFATGPELFYAGHHIDGGWLRGLMLHLEDRRVSINVISKSGTTTEPALAFRVLRQWMERKYGRSEAARRIIATTDASRGALRTLADSEGYDSFIIPDEVGGRFSVMTAVGLLPIATAGIDVPALLAGAAAMRERTEHFDDDVNPALCYASLRDAMYRSGKRIEILASFIPALASVAEWWKQLFGESEGKQGKGLFPASVQNTTDLHSLGQYIQDGERLLFETFIIDAAREGDVTVPSLDRDDDGMGFVAGMGFHEVNRNALLGTAHAHLHGGVPNCTIELPRLDATSLGALFYMFQIAVSIGGYALGVNPFDQPGVEDYKRNMFALLGKDGFEARRKELRISLEGVTRKLSG